MAEQMIFKRYEIKYMLTRAQLAKLKEEMNSYMLPDVHGKSINCSLYYDTPDYRMIRKSMESPLYKEKIRVRSYGVANPDANVYIELKKKYDGVVYKRRVEMKEKEVMKYLCGETEREDSQIIRELNYCKKYYPSLQPACMLSYAREAFYGKDDHEFRITFDDNILWRDYDLNLHSGIYGEPVLQPDMVIMEVKVLDHFPMWLVKFLSKNKIYKTSFSKYATAYKTMYERKINQRGIRHYA